MGQEPRRTRPRYCVYAFSCPISVSHSNLPLPTFYLGVHRLRSSPTVSSTSDNVLSIASISFPPRANFAHSSPRSCAPLTINDADSIKEISFRHVLYYSSYIISLHSQEETLQWITFTMLPSRGRQRRCCHPCYILPQTSRTTIVLIFRPIFEG